MQKWIILGVIIFIVVIGAIVVFNIDIETEYIPEREIEEVELRKTIVSLYFLEKETGEISKETRLIDSKELLKNPYEKILNMLVEGPQNNGLDKILADDITIIESKFENGIVTINFSKEFKDTKNINKTIEAIRKSLTEFTEVTNIKILIDGVEYNEVNENETILENTNTSTSTDNVSEELIAAHNVTATE